jgi:Phosphodiester glycosidase
MSHHRNFTLIRQLLRYFITFVPLNFIIGCTQSAPVEPKPPHTAFRSDIMAPGIEMFTNTAKKAYVIEADLSKVELRSISGELTPAGKVGQMKFQEFWTKNNAQGNLHILVNGTFFQEYDKPTGIAFGLKQNNKLITYGYGLHEFPGQNVTISWSDSGISIEPYSRSTLNGKIPNVVGALSPTAGTNANRLLRRTFIGVKDLRPDKTYGKVLLFISPSATQSEAEQTLREFGAEHVAMLDGGASTGLIVNGKTLSQPTTRLPQTIGIFSK